MPLIKGKSQASFGKNVETEMHAGKPMKQSLAIAYAMKKKAKHRAEGGCMAEGGDVKFNENEQRSGYMPHKYAAGGYAESDSDVPAKNVGLGRSEGSPDGDLGFIKEEKMTGYRPMPEEHEMHDAAAMTEDDRDLNQHGAMEIGAQGMNEDNEPQHETMYGHPVENQGFPGDDHTLVGRVMKKYQQHYSEGGKVANKSFPIAEFEPNQFDDLVKDDDLEEHYTGANSGDEIGDEGEDERRRDIVSRVMRSRRLKPGRNPVPA